MTKLINNAHVWLDTPGMAKLAQVRIQENPIRQTNLTKISKYEKYIQ